MICFLKLIIYYGTDMWNLLIKKLYEKRFNLSFIKTNFFINSFQKTGSQFRGGFRSGYFAHRPILSVNGK